MGVEPCHIFYEWKNTTEFYGMKNRWKENKQKQILKQKYPFEELLKLQHVIGYQVEGGRIEVL